MEWPVSSVQQGSGVGADLGIPVAPGGDDGTHGIGGVGNAHGANGSPALFLHRPWSWAWSRKTALPFLPEFRDGSHGVQALAGAGATDGQELWVRPGSLSKNQDNCACTTNHATLERAKVARCSAMI